MSLTGFQRLTASAIALALCATIVVSAQRTGVLPGAARPKVVPGVAAPAARPAPGGQGQIAALQARLRDRPDDVKALGQLGQLYVQGARETGDPAYYPRAEAAFRRALERDPNDVTALAGLGALALARHQFGEALDWGERARALAPPTAAIYGVIGDAQIELGRYDDAVATFQQMVDLRPDLNSYTRVSYARELHGDVPGAIEAMRRAAAAGAPGQESTAWARVQLGHLHFNSGAPDAARAEYERALRELPDYPHALAGLGRVAAAGGDYAAAIELYRRATARVPIAEYVIALGDVYTVAGRPDAAAEQYALAGVQDRLLAANGANTDLEFALFAADRPEAGLTPRQVVDRASAAVAERSSIYAHDVLAWALYRAGDYEAAREQMDAALRLGTRDASFHFHAGAIAQARGDNDAARTHFAEALRINPHFSLLHAPVSRAALDELAGD